MTNRQIRRRRDRQPRRIRVRTKRHDQIDYDALARAVLEQAAMDDHDARAARSAGAAASRPNSERSAS